MTTEHTKTIKFDLGMNQAKALVLVRKTLDRWYLKIGYGFKDWKIELADNTVANGQRILEYLAVYRPGWRNPVKAFKIEETKI